MEPGLRAKGPVQEGAKVHVEKAKARVRANGKAKARYRAKVKHRVEVPSAVGINSFYY
jgi:hypothetical protein